MKTPLIVISGLCCHTGCKRVARKSERLGPEMWVSVCDEHTGKKITLDMLRIFAAADATERLKLVSL